MPDGFGYPASEEKVAEWVAERDETATREHGWNLFAALQDTSSGDWTWRNWCTETQAFATDEQSETSMGGTGKQGASLAEQAEKPMRTFKLAQGLTSGEDPINFPNPPAYAVPDSIKEKYEGTGCVFEKDGQWQLANGPQFQNNGDVMIAGVIYNDSAFDWIRSNNLYDATNLQDMRPPADRTKQIAGFKNTAIVLKPMLWPVSKDGYTALPVWDDLSDDYGTYSGFEIQSQWPRAVAVTLGKGGGNPVKVSFLDNPGVTAGGKPLGPNVYDTAAPVSIDNFYNFEPDLEKFHDCDKALFDMSAYYAYGRLFEQGDRLALVAMHIQTKEQASWTFQSVWWSDKPDYGPYSTFRPDIPQATGPWRHYLMTSTYGWPAEPGGSTWPIAYNPYIELAAAHPIKTNCQNCHSRASYPGQSDSYLATGGPGALDIFSYEGESIFNGLIGTDSLWSVSDRAICSNGSKPPCTTK